MNFNPDANFLVINGPIQLPIPDHVRPSTARSSVLEYRAPELPEPLNQATYPSTSLPHHGTSSF